MKIQCLLGPAETDVGQATYRFQYDHRSRAVAEVIDHTHQQILLGLDAYVQVIDDEEDDEPVVLPEMDASSVDDGDFVEPDAADSAPEPAKRPSPADPYQGNEGNGGGATSTTATSTDPDTASTTDGAATDDGEPATSDDQTASEPTSNDEEDDEPVVAATGDQDIADMTKPQLLDYARVRNLTVNTRMSKQELIDAIIAAEDV